jgi:hypothetical protein
MKNNNKLTLKQLQAELEAIKSKSKSVKGPSKTATPKKSDVAGHDIKNSYINNLHMKSSMFYLWLITGILGYGRKIPIINKFISLLSLWYGRTTIWKILIKLRKLFVVFNALIGVIVVFKTTGFGVDTFWAHFSAMGTEYAIIFKNFVSRLFQWLFNLFDHKIVPNVPDNNPTGGSSLNSVRDYLKGTDPISKDHWNPIWHDRHNLPKFSLRELYTNGTPNINFQQSTPWYKDWGTLLWVGRFVGLLGLGYFGYKIYTDPIWLASIKGTIPQNPGDIQNNVDGNIAEGSPITQTIINTAKDVTKGIGIVYAGVRDTLNPFKWFNYASELERQSQRFMANQKSLTNAMDDRFYPFTEIHPYRPWYHRIRILTLGESTLENQERLRLRDHILRDATSITLADTRSLGSMTPATTVGVGVKPVGVEFTGMLDAVQTWAKVKSVSTTPNVVPSTSAPIPEFGGNWDINLPKNDELGNFVAESKTIKGKSPVVASLIPTVVESTTNIVEATTTMIESSSGSSGSSVAGNVSTHGSGYASPAAASNVSGHVSPVVENNPVTNPTSHHSPNLKLSLTAPTKLKTTDEGILDPLFQ